MSTSALLNALAGGYEGLTFAVRPVAWVHATRGTLSLAKPDVRKEALTQLKEDPVGTWTGGLGVFVGAGLFEAGRAGLKQKISDIKQAERVRRLAKFKKEYPLEDFYPYKEAHLLEFFPEETTLERSHTFYGFEKQRTLIQDPGGGYRIVDYDFKRGPAFKEPSGISLESPDIGLKTTRVPGRLRASVEATGEGHMLLRVGDRYGLVRTGGDLVPGLIPEGQGVFRDVLKMRKYSIGETAPGYFGKMSVEAQTGRLISRTSRGALPIITIGAGTSLIDTSRGRGKTQDPLKPIDPILDHLDKYRESIKFTRWSRDRSKGREETDVDEEPDTVPIRRPRRPRPPPIRIVPPIQIPIQDPIIEDIQDDGQTTITIGGLKLRTPTIQRQEPTQVTRPRVITGLLPGLVPSRPRARRRRLRIPGPKPKRRRAPRGPGHGRKIREWGIKGPRELLGLKRRSR